MTAPGEPGGPRTDATEDGPEQRPPDPGLTPDPGGTPDSGRRAVLGILGALAAAALCLGIVTAPLSPLPLLYVHQHVGFAGGVLVAIGGTALLAIAHQGLAVVFLLNFGLLGLVLAEGLRRRVGFAVTMLGGVAAVTIANGATLVLESSASGRTVREYIATEFDRTAELLDLSAALGGLTAGEPEATAPTGEPTAEPGATKLAPPPVTDDGAVAERQAAPAPAAAAEPEPTAPDPEAERRAELVREIAINVAPALMVWSAAAVAMANLLLGRALFRKRTGGNAFEYGELKRWSAPEWLVWLLIAAGFTLVIQQLALGRAWNDTQFWALNAVLTVLLVYYLQGLAITAFYLARAKFPPILRGLTYLLVMTQQLLVCALMALGVFDMWLDFRRLQAKPEAGGGESG